MQLSHPLDFIPENARKRVFLALLAGTLILFAVFRILNAPLVTSASPAGIVSFELAGTPEQAKLMIDVWTNRVRILTFTDGENTNALIEPAEGNVIEFSEETAEPVLYNPIPVLYAAFSLGLDYLFMPLYALAIALGALLAGGRHSGWVKSLGAVAGWGALGAAAFDAVENFALWQLLTNEVARPWPELAAICAKIKFGLILVGIVYALIAGLFPVKKKSD